MAEGRQIYTLEEFKESEYFELPSYRSLVSEWEQSRNALIGDIGTIASKLSDQELSKKGSLLDTFKASKDKLYQEIEIHNRLTAKLQNAIVNQRDEDLPEIEVKFYDIDFSDDLGKLFKTKDKKGLIKALNDSKTELGKDSDEKQLSMKEFLDLSVDLGSAVTTNSQNVWRNSGNGVILRLEQRAGLEAIKSFQPELILDMLETKSIMVDNENARFKGLRNIVENVFDAIKGALNRNNKPDIDKASRAIGDIVDKKKTEIESLAAQEKEGSNENHSRSKESWQGKFGVQEKSNAVKGILEAKSHDTSKAEEVRNQLARRSNQTMTRG